MTPSITLEGLSTLRSDQLLPGRTHTLLDLGCSGACPRSARISSSVHELDARAWDRLTAGLGPWARRGSLAAAERGAGPGAQHRYVVFERDGEATGVAAVRLDRFHAPALSELLPDDRLGALLGRLMGLGEGPLAVPVLVCSVGFGCGGTGFHFREDVDPRDAMAQLSMALRRIAATCPPSQRPVGLVLEEAVPPSEAWATALRAHGYSPVDSGPRMVLALDLRWRDFDDYSAALKSKFRVKAKRAYAKSAALEPRRLGGVELARQAEALAALHAAVVSKADFRVGEGGLCLASLMDELGDDVIVQAYLLDGEPVGWLCAIEHDGVLMAHSVGFDQQLNRRLSIYPRMLCDFLRIALERGLHTVDYGRTAQQIKSTIGAVPVPTRSHVRLRSELLSPLLGGVLGGLEAPREPLRQPFKVAVLAQRAA